MTIVLTQNDKNKVINFTVQDAAGTANSYNRFKYEEAIKEIVI